MIKFEKWLFFLASLPIFTVFGSDVGIPIVVGSIYSIAILAFPLINTVPIRRKSEILAFKPNLALTGFSLIIFNIASSISPIKSLLYWLIFLTFIYGIASWMKLLKSRKFEQLSEIIKNKLGYFILISIFYIYFFLFILGYGNLKTYNSFGIISGSAFCYFWFLRTSNRLTKIFILLLLFYFIFISLSRSSAIISIISVSIVEILFSRNKSRIVFFLSFLLIISSAFSKNFITWILEKENSKIDIQSLSDLGKINDRTVLIDHFFKVYDKRIISGYGINTDYHMLKEWDAVSNTGVHNGILEMILLTGLPISFYILFLTSISVRNLIRLTYKNHTYKPLLCFIIYCILRSYGESYFVLNIGNLMSLSFIIVLIYFYQIDEKTFVSLAKSQKLGQRC